MTHFDLCDLPPCCSNGTNILSFFLKAIVLSLGSQVMLFLTFFFVLHWLQWKCCNGITKSVSTRRAHSVDCRSIPGLSGGVLVGNGTAGQAVCPVCMIITGSKTQAM